MPPIIHDYTVPSAALHRIQQAYMVKLAALQTRQPQIIKHPTAFTLTYGQSPKLVLPAYMHTNPRYMLAVRALNNIGQDKYFMPLVQYKLPAWNDSYLTTGSIRPDGSIVGVQPRPVKAQPVVQSRVPVVSPAPKRPAAPASTRTQAAQPAYNVYLKNILQHWNNTPAYFDALLDGIKHAEMYDWIQQDKDLFIRTAARPDKTKKGWEKKSSTAFGPYQITYKLAKDMFNRYPTLMAKHRKFYDDVLKPEYELFLKHGNQQGKPWYNPRYDYGGAGKGLNLLLRRQYMLFARDVARIRFALMMVKHKYTSDKDAMHGFIQVWHSNPDQQYTRRVIDRLRSAYPEIYQW